MVDQTTYMYRQTIEYPDFTAAYLSSLRANSVWYIDASPDWVPAFDSSDFLVYDHLISIVTSGRLKAENSKHTERIHEAGSPINISRSKTVYRCTSLVDDTTSVSLFPKQNIIYNRELYTLSVGQSVQVPTIDKPTHFYIAKGLVSINGTERGAFHMLKIEPNQEINVVCSEDSYLVRIWE